MTQFKRVMAVSVLIWPLLIVDGFSAEKVKLVPLEPIKSGQAVPRKQLEKRPGYNLRGRIDAVRQNEMVIDDRLRLMNASTQVYSHTNRSASRRILLPGRWVEYKLGSGNIIEKIRLME